MLPTVQEQPQVTADGGKRVQGVAVFEAGGQSLAAAIDQNGGTVGIEHVYETRMRHSIQEN